jgi:hypothetical protein
MGLRQDSQQLFVIPCHFFFGFHQENRVVRGVASAFSSLPVTVFSGVRTGQTSRKRKSKLRMDRRSVWATEQTSEPRGLGMFDYQ